MTPLIRHARPVVCDCSECRFDRAVEWLRAIVGALAYLAVGLVAAVAVWASIVLMITLAQPAP